MSGTERVLVAGGGPAGMTAAIALRGQGLQAELVEIDPEWAPKRFTERRYERCRIVVENSVPLGEWEKHPGTPGAEPGRVVGETSLILTSLESVFGFY